LNCSAVLQVQPGYKLKGVIYKYKPVLADKPVATLMAQNLIGTKVTNDRNAFVGYNYAVQFPWMPEVTPDEDHTIQFWLEDANGTRMSQVFEVKFKL
jgi:hypothetical protein